MRFRSNPDRASRCPGSGACHPRPHAASLAHAALAALLACGCVRSGDSPRIEPAASPAAAPLTVSASSEPPMPHANAATRLPRASDDIRSGQPVCLRFHPELPVPISQLLLQQGLSRLFEDLRERACPTIFVDSKIWAQLTAPDALEYPQFHAFGALAHDIGHHRYNASTVPFTGNTPQQ